MSIWLPRDGVHLTASAYMDVYNCLQQQLTSPSTATSNRERLPSIIPSASAASAAGAARAPDNIPTPAWMRGEKGPRRFMRGARGGWNGRGRFGRRGRRGAWAPY